MKVERPDWSRPRRSFVRACEDYIRSRARRERELSRPGPCRPGAADSACQWTHVRTHFLLDFAGGFLANKRYSSSVGSWMEAVGPHGRHDSARTGRAGIGRETTSRTIGTIGGLRLTEAPLSDPVGQAGGWPPWAARPPDDRNYWRPPVDGSPVIGPCRPGRRLASMGCGRLAQAAGGARRTRHGCPSGRSTSAR
jgi:hypothetical protein